MEQMSAIDRLFDLGAFPEDEVQSAACFEAALQEELLFHYTHNERFKQFCDRKGFDPRQPYRLEDIPPVSASVFKELGAGLRSVSPADVQFALQSSATSGVPSTVVVDKLTAKRQSKAMIKVLRDFIGPDRKPFLIMDIDPRSADRHLLGARFAAVSGYLTFASKVGYFLKADDRQVSYFDVEAMQAFLATLDAARPVVVFGFTYILYAQVLQQIRRSGARLPLPAGSKVIHIGGWKKLESEKIGKEQFNSHLAAAFGIAPEDIIDIYGFTEQMGLNYPDCPCGCKHTPAFSRLIVRDIVSRAVLPAGEKGMLEFITPIPHSYPGNAVLTDDLGVIEAAPCPYGRPGTRFRILGRVKKAEVRGCGDILSSKLAFRTAEKEAGPIDERLEVLLHAGELHAAEPAGRLDEIIASLKERSAWLSRQPVEALAGLVAEVARKWQKAEGLQHLRDKGLYFLSSWCDEKHLQSMMQVGLKGDSGYLDAFRPFPDSERHYLKANPRGLACHWLAGNVQILGFFALIQSILTKNVNLLKVSSRDNGVFTELLGAFKGVRYRTAAGYELSGDELLQTVSVVYFSREAVRLGRVMSEQADVRIAWGGKDAIETVAAYPARFDAESVLFGPKLSYAVVAREALQTENDAKKLARRIAVDVSVFDQTGCASPHNLFLEAGGAVSAGRFLELLAEAMEKTEVQLPKPPVAAEQVAQIHSTRGVYDFKGYVKGSPSLSWTLLMDRENVLCPPVYSRVLFIHEIASLSDALIHISPDIQTIGVEAPRQKALEFAAEATLRGVARCPQIGRMLNFEMPWDGIFLFDRLVRWNTCGGPLR